MASHARQFWTTGSGADAPADALGFLLTGATIWLVPAVEKAVGWHLALAGLAVGPSAGIVAMRRLLVARARLKVAD